MNKVYTVTLTLPDGRRKYFRGKTKKEAEAKREAARLDLLRGINIGDRTTVAELASTWLETTKEGHVRDISLRNYRSQIESHIVPSLGAMRVRDVKPAHIRKMLSDMRDLSKATQRLVLQTTAAIFEMAVENELIPRSPCLRSIKPSGETPKTAEALSAEQVEQLLDAARGTDMYLFVLLGVRAGLRRGEILGLQWSDIDLDAGTLTVNRSIVNDGKVERGRVSLDLKTSAAHRTVPVPKAVAAELRAARAESRSIYVVHGRDNDRMGYDTAYAKWRRLLAKLDFDAHPHTLRHTCVTNWVKQGLDIKEVQYLAGHSSSQMTLDVYSHYLASERLEETARKIQEA